jgi:large subunit ribosomal protein L17
MRRNLVASLFEHETISTTIEKAKEAKPFAEKLITLARKGTLAARRRAIAMLGNRDIVADEDGKAVRKGTVVGKLFSELGPRYLDRPGGYTRIIHLSLRRLGDNGQLVLLQLVGEEEKKKKSKSKRSRKKARKPAKAEQVVEAEQAAEAEEAPATEERHQTKETTEETAQTEAAVEDQRDDESSDQADADEKEQ